MAYHASIPSHPTRHPSPTHHPLQTYEEDASPELQAAIEDAFGSYDAFKANFSAAAAGVFGSGWAWLVAGDDGELSVVATPNQASVLMQHR